jgi:hypothetical protein
MLRSDAPRTLRSQSNALCIACSRDPPGVQEQGMSKPPKHVGGDDAVLPSSTDAVWFRSNAVCATRNQKDCHKGLGGRAASVPL